MPSSTKSLITAIDIAAASKALLLHVQDTNLSDPADDNQEFLGFSLFKARIGIAPMLLALSMEYALKAWFVLDEPKLDIPKTHDLLKLFSRLSPSTQVRLKSKYDATILPHRSSLFYSDDGLERVLTNARNAFIEWRYIHELDRARFDHGVFEETIEMVVNEFESSIVVKTPPTFFNQN